MLVWVFAALVALSASGLLYAALGPLRGTPSTATLTAFAFVQYGLAAVLVVARLAGWA